MPFVPRVAEIETDSLVAFKGERGDFVVGSAGGRPEREWAFYYEDQRYAFCFYAEKAWDGAFFDVDIYDASIARFFGPRPEIRAEDLGYIKSNLTLFFSQRDFISSSYPLPSTEMFRSLSVSGGLVSAAKGRR